MQLCYCFDAPGESVCECGLRIHPVAGVLPTSLECSVLGYILFGVQNMMFGPYSAATHRCLISVIHEVAATCAASSDGSQAVSSVPPTLHPVGRKMKQLINPFAPGFPFNIFSPPPPAVVVAPAPAGATGSVPGIGAPPPPAVTVVPVGGIPTAPPPPPASAPTGPGFTVVGAPLPAAAASPPAVSVIPVAAAPPSPVAALPAVQVRTPCAVPPSPIAVPNLCVALAATFWKHVCSRSARFVEEKGTGGEGSMQAGTGGHKECMP
jgi:hypothetical protein